jgi:5-keto-L-gluconate epimerase
VPRFRLSYALTTQPAQFAAISYAQDLGARLNRLAELGYDGVELHVRDPRAEDVARLEAFLAASRLPVSAIGTGQAYGEDGLSFTDPLDEVRQAAVARCRSHIELAARLAPDAPLVIIGLMRGRVATGADAAAAEGWLLAALGELALFAADLGVRLCLEPINRYETNLLNTVAESLALLDRLAADNVGLLFDTFHANIEEPNPLASIDAAGPRLFHVHVADSNRRHPGAGHLDFPQVLAALTRIAYSGWLSAEILPQPDPETALTQTIDTLRPGLA